MRSSIRSVVAAREQLARGPAVVEGHRQPLQMPVEVGPHRRLDAAPAAGPPASAAARTAPPRRCPSSSSQRAAEPHPARVPVGDRAVHHPLQDERDDQARDRRRRPRRTPRRTGALAPGDVRPQPQQRSARRTGPWRSACRSGHQWASLRFTTDIALMWFSSYLVAASVAGAAPTSPAARHPLVLTALHAAAPPTAPAHRSAVSRRRTGAPCARRRRPGPPARCRRTTSYACAHGGPGSVEAHRAVRRVQHRQEAVVGHRRAPRVTSRDVPARTDTCPGSPPARTSPVPSSPCRAA